MEKETKFERISEIVSNYSDEEFVRICNKYDFGDHINAMEDADDFFSGYSVMEALEEFYFSQFDTSDYWFVADGSSLISSDDPRDFISDEDLADYALMHDCDLCDDSIREILDESEEEEEETPLTYNLKGMTMEEVKFLATALDVTWMRLYNARSGANRDSLDNMSTICARLMSSLREQIEVFERAEEIVEGNG